MATLISFKEFATSNYADMADQVDNIELVINQAEAAIKSQLSRDFSETDYEEIHYPKNDKIFLKERPIIAIDSISRRSSYLGAWVSTDLSSFRVNTSTGVIRSLSQDLRGDEVRVLYSAGYTTVPDDIKAATILQTVILAFTDYEVFGAGDGKEPAIKHLQAAVDRLLQPYKKSAIF
jgi:hypothetical protein